MIDTLIRQLTNLTWQYQLGVLVVFMIVVSLFRDIIFPLLALVTAGVVLWFILHFVLPIYMPGMHVI